MFSGKTSYLMGKINEFADNDIESIIVKYHKDNRYNSGNVITSHSGDIIQPSNKIKIVQVDRLMDIKVSNESVIGIDEGQFFPDLIEFSEKWANTGRHIIISALDGDFARQPFGQVCELIPKCDTFIKLKGICMKCGSQPSVFSQRIVDITETIHIGAAESYMSVCRKCYFR